MRFAHCSLRALSAVLVSTAAWAQVKAGPEFQVNTYTTRQQLLPSVAVQPNGDFVVLWYGDGPGEEGYGVFGQRYSAAGARAGAEFHVNTYTQQFQGWPDVATRSNGSFIVVWGGHAGGYATDIRGQLFDALANRVGAEFQVNEYTTSGQTFPQLDAGPDGGFVVTWMSTLADGSGRGIAARRFDAAATPRSSEFVVNTSTTGDQYICDVAVAPDGSFVIVWDDHAPYGGDAWAIRAQRFDASGLPAGSEFRVSSATNRLHLNPSVSAGPSGEFVAVWTRRDVIPNYDVLGRRFDATGAPIGAEFVANTYTTLIQDVVPGGVAHDRAGNFIVAWKSSQEGSSFGVFAQRFDSEGTRRGGEFRVNAYTTNSQESAAVADDAVGNFVVSWMSRDQDGSGYGIFAQRFGGLQPAALAVDGGGNSVLEPGETASVAPSWRNVNGVVQTFGGGASAFTGPVGPTYELQDATGNYGTVANGGTQPCVDCYQVRIQAAARPVQHWDASLLETISPDVMGQAKRWRLHVGASFTDVPAASPFYRFVETLLHRGITSGCGGTTYCPASATTREQMSVFVLVAKEGAGYGPPACGTPVFADVPASSPFCRWIEELARRGVTGGCGGGNYCPTAAVSREQMAVFVLRTLDPALDPPACTTPVFNDVPASSPFCRWIEELARRGVVGGCAPNLYCPSAPVTREQMAVFLTGTFGLTLYGP